MCHQIMYKKPLYLILNSGNGYIKESNGNEYLTLITTDESKNTLERYGKVWSKVKDLIRSKNDNSDDYDEKYMKIKFDSSYDLPLKKTIELHGIIIAVRSVFNDSNEYYPQIFLDDCSYKVAG